MRKTLIGLFGILVLVLASCASQTSEGATPSPTPTPLGTPSPDASANQCFLVYADADIDMMITVYSYGAWTYFKDDDLNEVYFLPEGAENWFPSLAISSYKSTLDPEMDHEDIQEDARSRWDDYFHGLKESCPDVELLETGTIPTGAYTAMRYGFRFSTGDGAARGDFIIWWTGDRTYTCTFISYENEYEVINEMVEQTLDSFTQSDA